MLLNGNRNWNIPVYECLIRLNYHSHAMDDVNRMYNNGEGINKNVNLLDNYYE